MTRQAAAALQLARPPLPHVQWVRCLLLLLQAAAELQRPLLQEVEALPLPLPLHLSHDLRCRR